MAMNNLGSRFPRFYELDPQERLRTLQQAGLISEQDGAFLLDTGQGGLPLETADHMIENTVGVIGLPIGLGLNFLIDGKDYVVPMAVEEPSVVAAASLAAKIVRGAGGFTTEVTNPVMLGQLQIISTGTPDIVEARIMEHREELLKQANAACENMAARGGGAKDLDVRNLGPIEPNGHGPRWMLALHVHLDTRDAMGANTVNTVMESLAPDVEALTGADVHLRILSNLTDRCLAKARCTIPSEHLACAGYEGDEVADRIRLASLFAESDPYRAATHNKGIMNGIDAVAIAMGNDWRAIEAGAHAYAARGGQYTALARWSVDDDGALVGELDLPLAVGTVGGSGSMHPTVGALRRLLGVADAKELRSVMASVGLAQNLAAIRALATEGIQRGHMALHARSVAASAGAPPELVGEVAKRLVDEGDIKIRRAQEILDTLNPEG